MPGEVAIFVKGGNIEGVFDKGTYKLSTENYPFISRLRNAFTGGISTFNCVVYFVRKADSQEIIWGTDTPIQVRDKVWGVRTEARVRGAYKVRIENPVKFLEKMVGNNILFQTQEDLTKYFQQEFQGKIKSSVSKFLNAIEHELIGIDAYMDELSDKVEPYIDEALDGYGLKCVKFSLSGLDVDISKYDQIDNSQIELITRTRGYQGDKAGLDILGDDWVKVQGMEILKNVSNNPGAGGIASVGAGIGMGLGTAETFGTLTQQIFAPSGNKNESKTTDAVTSQTIAQDDPVQVLGKLKKMLDAGLIEKEEYDAKKQEILSRI